MFEEVKVSESERQEAKEVDSIDVIRIKKTDLWFSERSWLVA